jgi:ribulose-5-phosphate 4-epimerase/fuculose-1-phosphate aldolase
MNDSPLSNTTVWLNEQRSELCRLGRSLFERGYVHATAGNLSVRVPASQGGGLLITPTDACLGFLAPADLVWVDDAGQVRGPGRASKTAALHHSIYQADAQAGCIIHTHSTHTVALTLMDPGGPGAELLPPITPYFVMKVGRVPRVPYHRPGDPAVALVVSQTILQAQSRGLQLRAVMLDRLGPNVWHRTPSEAMAVLEELEETAHLHLLTQGRSTPLDEAQIQALREQFGATW